jgi:hypothetical protein
VVSGFRQPAGRTGAFECRRDFGNADSEWNLYLRGQGDGQRISGTDSFCERIDYGERRPEQGHDYDDEPGCGQDGKLVQRDAEREWRNAGLRVVDCVGKSAGRIDTLERRCDFGHADGKWHGDVHGWGEGRWIACANGLGPRVDRGEHDASDADDYLDELGCGEEWKLVQRDAECEWRNAGLYVVDCVGKFAGRIDTVERWRDFGHADGKWHGDVHGCREG